MANRRHSVRRVRRRYTYNVREAAKVTGATPGTVRLWLKQGLEPVRGIYPTIIRGVDIIVFFDRVREARKHSSGPGRLFCFGCKSPKRPAFDVVEFFPDGPKLGFIRGLCPDCSSVMNRRVSRVRLDEVVADLKVSMQPAESRLGGTVKPNCNDDSERG
jgi:hypothetical protein